MIQDTKKRGELENALKNYEKAAGNATREIVDKFNKCIPDVFLYPLVKKTALIIGAEDLSNKGIPDMNSSTLKHILESGKCICGKDIKNDEESRKHINELFKYLPPEAIGTVVLGLQKDLDAINADAYDRVKDVENAYRRYLDAEEEIQELNTLLNNISMRLQDTPDVKSLENDRCNTK